MIQSKLQEPTFNELSLEKKNSFDCVLEHNCLIQKPTFRLSVINLNPVFEYNHKPSSTKRPTNGAHASRTEPDQPPPNARSNYLYMTKSNLLLK